MWFRAPAGRPGAWAPRITGDTVAMCFSNGRVNSHSCAKRLPRPVPRGFVSAAAFVLHLTSPMVSKLTLANAFLTRVFLLLFFCFLTYLRCNYTVCHILILSWELLTSSMSFKDLHTLQFPLCARKSMVFDKHISVVYSPVRYH